MYRQRNKLITRYRGLSTDDKPQGAEHGSSFHEMDTGTIYYFDHEHEEWYEAPGSRKFEPEEKTATGSVASFETDLVRPMRSVAVAMEPIQNLNGQDAPYPGGGSKNLLPMTMENMKSIQSVNGTWSGNTYTLYGVSYAVNTDDGGNVTGIIVNGTASQYSLFRLCNEFTTAESMMLRGSSSSSAYQGHRLQGESEGRNYQSVGGGNASIPANTEFTRIIIVVPTGANADNALYQPMLILSTETNYTFAPYSNICPISGRSEVGVWRSGKNLLEGVTNDLISLANNAASVINGTGTCLIAHVVEGQTYVFSNANINRGVVSYWDALPSVGDSTSYYQNVQGQTFTALKTGLVLIYIYNAATDTSTAQIELGSTATAYEAPSIQSITLQLGQTVYGGTVDAVSGVMTVERIARSFTFSTPTTKDNKNRWELGVNLVDPLDAMLPGQVSINTNYPWVISNLPLVIEANAVEGQSSCMFYGHGQRVEYRVRIADTYTAEEAKAIADASVVCYMTNPVTVQLTAQQLTTLLGTNNVWSDGGNVTVKYIAKKGE